MAGHPDHPHDSIMIFSTPASEALKNEKSYQSNTQDFDEFVRQSASIRQLPIKGRSRVTKSVRSNRNQECFIGQEAAHGTPQRVNSTRKGPQVLNFSGLHEDPSFGPDMTPMAGFESPSAEYHAQPPAQVGEPFPISAYHLDHQNQCLQLENTWNNALPPAEFISWAREQIHLDESPGQISIWCHLHKIPQTTVEKWYQHYKILGPVIENDVRQITWPGPESSVGTSMHRVKCLESQTPRGRYNNSADSSARGRYICTSGCGVNFKRKSDWRRHEDNNFPVEEWTCTICYQVFTQAYEVARHKKTAHKTPLGELTCAICSQTFTRLKKLASHMSALHKRGQVIVSGVSYRSLPDNYHRRCHPCGLRFPRIGEFYTHALEHMGGRLGSNVPTHPIQGSTAVGHELGTNVVPELQQANYHGSDDINLGNPGLDVEWLLGNWDQ